MQGPSVSAISMIANHPKCILIESMHSACQSVALLFFSVWLITIYLQADKKRVHVQTLTMFRTAHGQLTVYYNNHIWLHSTWWLEGHPVVTWLHAVHNSQYMQQMVLILCRYMLVFPLSVYNAVVQTPLTIRSIFEDAVAIIEAP